MIDFVKGRVAYLEKEYIVISVGGIGYQVFVPDPNRFGVEEPVQLFTHFVVREDSQLLYGFSTKDERDFFRLLLEVSGIGPKAGMLMIGGSDLTQMVHAIQSEDVKFLTRFPGIGKKTAGRIILDLKDKLVKQGWTKRVGPTHSSAASPATTYHGEADVIEALMGLGYTEGEAQMFVSEARKEADHSLTTEEWIRRALQISMRR
jgi:Holliday junction DNA helicase RuvA